MRLNAEAKRDGGGEAIQILQRVFIAMLLAVSGWLCNSELQSRRDITEIQTRMSERRKVWDDQMEKANKTLELIYERQQDVLRRLVHIEDSDKMFEKHFEKIDGLLK